MSEVSYFLQNEMTELFARHDSQGEHDGKVTQNLEDAKEFQTRAEAYEFAQNFGPHFNIVEI